MKILIACEFSGIVREAFRARGHDAWSCDLLESEQPGQHIVGDVRDLLTAGWDMLIGFPPCTYLCNSGVRWLYKHGTREREKIRWREMEAGARFFLTLWRAPITRTAIENPIMHGHAQKIIGRSADQITHPHWFGHGETKATGLHLKNLPPLTPTNPVDGRAPVVHFASPGPNRWKDRSRTRPGFANAMAAQWGNLP